MAEAEVLGGKQVLVTSLNAHITCSLCGGYLVDATCVTDCLHTFCRSCLLRHMQSSMKCPSCDVTISTDINTLNIRRDKTIQDLVYKLVPKLFKDEMHKRRKFVLQHMQKTGSASESHSSPETDKATNETTTPSTMHSGCQGNQDGCHGQQAGCQGQQAGCLGQVNGCQGKKIESTCEYVSVCLQLYDTHPELHSNVSESADTRYLRCPGAMTVAHLKKFVTLKFGLGEKHQVTCFYLEERLDEEFTLSDVINVYGWTRVTPLRITYTVFDPVARLLSRPLATSSTRIATASSRKQPAKLAPKQPAKQGAKKKQTHPNKEPNKSSQALMDKKKLVNDAKDKSASSSVKQAVERNGITEKKHGVERNGTNKQSGNISVNTQEVNTGDKSVTSNGKIDTEADVSSPKISNAINNGASQTSFRKLSESNSQVITESNKTSIPTANIKESQKESELNRSNMCKMLSHESVINATSSSVSNKKRKLSLSKTDTQETTDIPAKVTKLDSKSEKLSSRNSDISDLEVPEPNPCDETNNLTPVAMDTNVDSSNALSSSNSSLLSAKCDSTNSNVSSVLTKTSIETQTQSNITSDLPEKLVIKAANDGESIIPNGANAEKLIKKTNLTALDKIMNKPKNKDPTKNRTKKGETDLKSPIRIKTDVSRTLFEKIFDEISPGKETSQKSSKNAKDKSSNSRRMSVLDKTRNGKIISRLSLEDEKKNELANKIYSFSDDENMDCSVLSDKPTLLRENSKSAIRNSDTDTSVQTLKEVASLDISQNASVKTHVKSKFENSSKTIQNDGALNRTRNKSGPLKLKVRLDESGVYRTQNVSNGVKDSPPSNVKVTNMDSSDSEDDNPLVIDENQSNVDNVVSTSQSKDKSELHQTPKRKRAKSSSVLDSLRVTQVSSQCLDNADLQMESLRSSSKRQNDIDFSPTQVIMTSSPMPSPSMTSSADTSLVSRMTASGDLSPTILHESFSSPLSGSRAAVSRLASFSSLTESPPGSSLSSSASSCSSSPLSAPIAEIKKMPEMGPGGQTNLKVVFSLKPGKKRSASVSTVSKQLTLDADWKPAEKEDVSETARLPAKRLYSLGNGNHPVITVPVLKTKLKQEVHKSEDSMKHMDISETTTTDGMDTLHKPSALVLKHDTVQNSSLVNITQITKIKLSPCSDTEISPLKSSKPDLILSSKSLVDDNSRESSAAKSLDTENVTTSTLDTSNKLDNCQKKDQMSVDNGKEYLLKANAIKAELKPDLLSSLSTQTTLKGIAEMTSPLKDIDSLPVSESVTILSPSHNAANSVTPEGAARETRDECSQFRKMEDFKSITPPKVSPATIALSTIAKYRENHANKIRTNVLVDKSVILTKTASSVQQSDSPRKILSKKEDLDKNAHDGNTKCDTVVSDKTPTSVTSVNVTVSCTPNKYSNSILTVPKPQKSCYLITPSVPRVHPPGVAKYMDNNTRSFKIYHDITNQASKNSPIPSKSPSLKEQNTNKPSNSPSLKEQNSNKPASASKPNQGYKALIKKPSSITDVTSRTTLLKADKSSSAPPRKPMDINANCKQGGGIDFLSQKLQDRALKKMNQGPAKSDQGISPGTAITKSAAVSPTSSSNIKVTTSSADVVTDKGVAVTKKDNLSPVPLIKTSISPGNKIDSVSEKLADKYRAEVKPTAVNLTSGKKVGHVKPEPLPVVPTVAMAIHPSAAPLYLNPAFYSPYLSLTPAFGAPYFHPMLPIIHPPHGLERSPDGLYFNRSPMFDRSHAHEYYDNLCSPRTSLSSAMTSPYPGVTSPYSSQSSDAPLDFSTNRSGQGKNTSSKSEDKSLNKSIEKGDKVKCEPVMQGTRKESSTS